MQSFYPKITQQGKKGKDHTTSYRSAKNKEQKRNTKPMPNINLVIPS